MSTRLIKVGNSFNVPQKTYICDSTDDRDKLKAYFGDLCLVNENGIGVIYILNSEGEWYPYPSGGGGGGDCSGLIAPDFSPTQPYPVNSTVIYQGSLYRAITNVSAGEFNSNEWTQIYATTPLGVPVIAGSSAPTDTSVLWLFEEGDEDAPYTPEGPRADNGTADNAHAY